MGKASRELYKQCTFKRQLGSGVVVEDTAYLPLRFCKVGHCIRIPSLGDHQWLVCEVSNVVRDRTFIDALRDCHQRFTKVLENA